MRLKSRGLGRKELVMDFREYTVTREGNEIVIEGTIREPVHWDFAIRMCQDDLPGISKVALSPKTLGFLIKAMFKRKKDAHWTLDRKEHLEEVKATIKAREEAKDSDAAEDGGKKTSDAAARKKKIREAAEAHKKKAREAADADADAPASSNGNKPKESASSGSGRTLSFTGSRKKTPDTRTSPPDTSSQAAVTTDMPTINAAAVPLRAEDRNAS